MSSSIYFVSVPQLFSWRETAARKVYSSETGVLYPVGHLIPHGWLEKEPHQAIELPVGLESVRTTNATGKGKLKHHDS